MVSNGREDVIYHEVKSVGLSPVWWLLIVAGVIAVIAVLGRRRAN